MAIIYTGQGAPSSGRNVVAAKAKPTSAPVSKVTKALARPAAAAPLDPSSAAGQAQAILGPAQLAAGDLYATHQNAVIQSFARSLLGQLRPVAGQVGADYNQAIQQIGGLSGQAAQYLSGQNPSAVQQALGASVGAPPEQQAQEAAQLGNTFRGGAGVLAFTQGVVPGSELAGDKAAAQASARQLPGIAALKGQQDLASALWQQSQDAMKLEATRPQLVQQAQSNIDTANYRAASLGQTAANRAESTREFNVSESDKRAIAAAKANAPAKQPGLHYYSDAAGNEYIYNPATGKVNSLPGQAKPAATPKPRYTTVTDSTGTYIVNEDTGARRRVGEGKAAATPTPHYTTVSDASGTYVVNEDTGARRRIAGPKVAAPSTSAPSTKTINGVTYEWDAGRRGWVRSGLPVAAAKTPSATAPTVHGDRQWDPVKKRWVRAPGLPAKTGAAARPLTAPESTKFTKSAMQIATNAANGGTNPKTGKHVAPISREQAQQEMRLAGLFADPRTAKIAMQALNEAYGTPKAWKKFQAGVRAAVGSVDIGLR